MKSNFNRIVKEVKIEGFKIFEKENFEFKNLTILTGENSSGKSSLIQALLFLGNPLGVVGTPFNNDLHSYLQSLGQKELFNKNSKKIKIKADDLEQNWQKNGNSYNTMVKNLSYPNPLAYIENLIYLNADRNRIRQTNQYIANLKERFFGLYGDLTSNYYEHNKRKKIETYFIKDNSSLTLETQVNYWLKEITGIKSLDFDTELITPTLVKNTFKLDNDEFLPENMGTGLSYLFTILTICLSAKKGNIIIIENPEIHLHPKSQAKLGEFFAFIASKGIQLIIETHNDHIINKICYEAYKNNISKYDVVIHYFSIPYDKTTIYIDTKGHFIDEQGRPTQFPEGFFDATLKEIFEINGY